MNKKTLVKISNVIATIMVILLIYWVFIFISVEVFGFKIFRQRMSETFGLSILGLFAALGGSMIINLMFNLTRIAERLNRDGVEQNKKSSKLLILGFALGFPLIFGILFGGDYLSSRKKEKMLVNSAKSVMDKYQQRTAAIANYSFDENWLAETDDSLDLFRKTDRNFPQVTVVVRDVVEGEPTFLMFNDYVKPTVGYPPKERKDYIFRSDEEQRVYLKSVFDGQNREPRFSAFDGNYELFYPYESNGKVVVLYFSDSQRYGKFGS